MAAIPLPDGVDLQQTGQLARALLHQLGADPGSPAEGQIWERTDLDQVHVVLGGAVQTLALVSAVVNALSSPDGSIEVGGTTTNPTVELGTVPHTSISDFTAAVQAIINSSPNSVDTPAQYASTAALPANTYNSGALTLTAIANGVLVVDGATPNLADRVLVATEAALTNNGLYTVTQVGSSGTPYILTRCGDFNSSATITPGLLIPVKAGSNETPGAVNDGKVFVTICPEALVLGTSSITFAQIGATYTAGTGITISGTTMSLSVPVSVTNGGTGGTTASAGRAGLEATGKFAGTIGDGSTTTFLVAHNLGTLDVDTVAYYVATGQRFYPDVYSYDTDHVQIVFSTAPTASSIRIVVVG